ncbi:PepSY-associated TM helix domain-containing protein [Novosphingobium sp. 9]|uniref:PepSY-associated TM helix domain-containing protein n=1 Tax=Novosphingobium sp. 9 TaxID=2025349 RepID=UPI0021B53538|nr:PepSY-associated TM helix domain-containing protein [Novosphingobium sp. 9]
MTTSDSAVRTAQPIAAPAKAPTTGTAAPVRRKGGWTRGFWLRQLHTWHWVSSALSLMALFLFVATGFTLNHAGDILAKPKVVDGSGQLAPAFIALLAKGPGDGAKVPVPIAVRDELARQSRMSIPADTAAEWSSDEVYLAMPRPGGDAWISVERGDGAISWETTDQGWIAYFNDLHKGRNAGWVWHWFIDGFVISALIFVGTGFALLWMHGRHRPSTWPLTGLGLLIPFILALFFIH